MLKRSVSYFWLKCLIGMQMFAVLLTNNASQRPHFDPRIVNGYRCPIEDHPYMVSIRRTKTFLHVCGGTIVSAFWILTAAHCCRFGYKSEEFTAVVGLSTIPNKSLSGPNVRLVVESYKHGNDVENDICLLRIDKPILQTNTTRYVQLANYLHQDLKPLDTCKEATVSGWGVQYEKDATGKPVMTPTPKHDPHLQCVKLSMIRRDLCDKKYKFRLPASVVCAYADGKDACQGDSGGPLLCNGIQYAISSFGIGCAFGGYPGAFTRVDIYENFLRTVLATRESYTNYSHLHKCWNTYKILLYICCFYCLLIK